MSRVTPKQRPRTGRPLPGEYADYASADIAAVPGDDAIDALGQLTEHTPAFFRTLATAAERGLTYSSGKWTLKCVLGHLVDDERIFAYRLLCVARGEDGELPGFDENRYAANGEFESRSLDDLPRRVRGDSRGDARAPAGPAACCVGPPRSSKRLRLLGARVGLSHCSARTPPPANRP